MNFEEKDGIYEVKLRCGDVVRFESEEEMRCAQMYHEEIRELLGHKKNNPSVAQLHKMSLLDSSLCTKEPKKIRIHIDPEVEVVGAERGTSSVSHGEPPSPRGRLKEKALA